MSKDFLFVYGTLRKAYGLKLMQEIADKTVFVGMGQVRAVLYDLGEYPAAIKSDRPDVLKGDVYEVKEPATVFEILDDYEGEEYQRERIEVKLDNGRTLEAWMYCYQGTVEKAKLVADGDYLSYLENKKDRFL